MRNAASKKIGPHEKHDLSLSWHFQEANPTLERWSILKEEEEEVTDVRKFSFRSSRRAH
jgi:hypothetical protein